MAPADPPSLDGQITGHGVGTLILVWALQNTQMPEKDRRSSSRVVAWKSPSHPDGWTG